LSGSAGKKIYRFPRRFPVPVPVGIPPPGVMRGANGLDGASNRLLSRRSLLRGVKVSPLSKGSLPDRLYVAAPASVQAVVDHHVWLVPSNHPVKLLRLLHTGIVRPTAVEPE